MHEHHLRTHASEEEILSMIRSGIAAQKKIIEVQTIIIANYKDNAAIGKHVKELFRSKE